MSDRGLLALTLAAQAWVAASCGGRGAIAIDAIDADGAIGARAAPFAVTTIARSGCGKQRVVIYTPGQWAAFTAPRGGISWPPVDFDKEMVIVVGKEIGSSPGQLQIGEILPAGERLSIKYVACPGQAMALSVGCHIVKTRRDARAPRFEEVLGSAHPWCMDCAKDPEVPCH